MLPLIFSCSLEVSFPCQSWPLVDISVQSEWRPLSRQSGRCMERTLYVWCQPGTLGRNKLWVAIRIWVTGSELTPPTHCMTLSCFNLTSGRMIKFLASLGKRGKIAILPPQNTESLEWKLAAMSGRNKGEKIALWAIQLGHKYPPQ